MSQNHHEKPCTATQTPSAETQQDDSTSIHSTASTSHSHSRTVDANTTVLKTIPTQDHLPLEHYTSQISIPDEIYDRLSSPRKIGVIIVVSFCSFLAPISSTTILAGVPEVSATYGTSGSVVNLSNALYMLFMGISPCFWGPMSQVYGRRNVSYLYIPFLSLLSFHIYAYAYIYIYGFLVERYRREGRKHVLTERKYVVNEWLAFTFRYAWLRHFCSLHARLARL